MTPFEWMTIVLVPLMGALWLHLFHRIEKSKQTRKDWEQELEEKERALADRVLVIETTHKPMDELKEAIRRQGYETRRYIRDKLNLTNGDHE